MKKFISALLCATMVFSGSVVAFAGTTQDRDDLSSTEFSDAYDYAWENGIFTSDDLGDNADAYMTGTVTRGDYALYIARLNNVDLAAYEVPAGYEEALTDMADCTDEEVYKAVAWCWANGVVNGYSDDTYRPEKEISREEICAMIARYYTGVPTADVDGLTKTDNIVEFIDDSASETNYIETETVTFNNETYTLLEFCVKYGLIQGDANGNFGFGGQTTRQQVMAILHRAGDAETVAETTKFYLGVKSGEGFVTATVNNSYIMQIVVSDAKVDPSEITLEAKMANVASLGVSGVREHSVTINTNIESDGSADLGVWLNECFAFTGCTVNITIADKVCAYNVGAAEIVDGNAVINFVPADVEATRAAWQELTSHVSTTTQATDDSSITIAAGSYLTLDDETLCFENGKGDLVLDNFSNMDALETEIRDKVKVEVNAETEGVIEAGLVAGTQLAVGSSIATLDDDVTITVEGVDTTLVKGQLSELRGADSTYAMAKQLVSLVNDLVGTLNGETVDVTVSFE